MWLVCGCSGVDRPSLSIESVAPNRVTSLTDTAVVVKADGLAAGKGVVVTDDLDELTFPKARYLLPKDEFDYWKGLYDKGDKDVNQVAKMLGVQL